MLYDIISVPDLKSLSNKYDIIEFKVATLIDYLSGFNFLH